MGSRGRSGSPSLGPTSTAPNGTMRGASAATPQPGHDGGGDRHHAAADENLGPGHAGLVEQLSGQGAHAAGFRHRGQRQRLARAMLPTRHREPTEFFFGQDFPIAAPRLEAHDHCIEFAAVETLKQFRRRSDPNLDQQMRILGIHARDQRGQFRTRDVVADADGKALPRSSNDRDRPVMGFDQLARMVKKGGALGRKLHVARRSLDQSEAQPFFQPFQLQADRGLRGP